MFAKTNQPRCHPCCRPFAPTCHRLGQAEQALGLAQIVARQREPEPGRVERETVAVHPHRERPLLEAPRLVRTALELVRKRCDEQHPRVPDARRGEVLHHRRLGALLERADDVPAAEELLDLQRDRDSVKAVVRRQ